MSFESDLDRFLKNLERRQKAHFFNVVSHVETSIKKGSAVTGAPGQPVDTSNLLNSWTTEFESQTRALVSTNAEYAEEIEDNARGATLRSEVGGFHSVKLTRAGFEKIVEHELKELGGQ